VNDDNKQRRIFIFFPGMNERFWRVLVPGGVVRTFGTEGTAVEYALERATQSRENDRRLVEVLKETASGGWMPITVPY